MHRFAAERIVEAARTSGVHPCQGTPAKAEDIGAETADILGLVLTAEGYPPGLGGSCGAVAALVNMHPAYMTGMLDGWDGRPFATSEFPFPARGAAQAGHADGCAALAACVEAFGDVLRFCDDE